MERIDDLQVNNLKLIQDDEHFCFGCDAVELANFVEGGKYDFAIDLGSGNGIIAVLLAGKKGIKTTAVEINESLAQLCQRNVVLNNLENLIDVINIPMQNLPSILPAGSRTIVVCNPPYFKVGSGGMRSGSKAGARHEVFVTIKEVVEIASYLLPTGGRFYTVFPTQRMAELLHLCISHRLEPKELVILNPKGKIPHLFLLKSVKDGKTGLKVFCRNIKDYGME